MPNRLANETSPYLLQHQNNPVDWYPWGDEAFARAKAEQKPIFLSVGYSSCHWCHVMEHESFEDEGVAALLNESFISVKVDREERPDVDEAYMAAVQMYAGRGGWPMSVFLTPDRKPFFAGTYFPKDDRGEYPGFTTLVRQVAALWANRRTEVLETADRFGLALEEALTTPAPVAPTTLNDEFFEQATAKILSDFDGENGGFGSAPKFPPHSAIEFLLGYGLYEKAPDQLLQASLGACVYTLEAMALGGIHDQVGGGFHRYSTDATWLLPHFEKMLYDNALLLRNYARAAALAHEFDPRLERLFARTAAGIVEWVRREMTSPDGLFFSALDADSEGEEGKFYVWTVDEVNEILGTRAASFLAAYGFREEGNFHEEATGRLTGANIPHLAQDDQGGFKTELAALREAREKRVRPGLDDKALVGWNGLMIAALADAGALDLAGRAAQAILDAERQHGGLPRQIAKGTPSGHAFLEDYAYLIDGLMSLAAYRSFLEANQEELRKHGVELDGPTAQFWAGEARRLASEMVKKFEDPAGGFFATSDRHEVLFGRTKPVFDQPIPSANAVALRCLWDLGETDVVRRGLSAFIGWAQRAPSATEALLSVALRVHQDGPDSPAVVEPTPIQAAPVALPVNLRLEPKELQADASGKGTFVLRIEVPEGLHLNTANPPARWLVPTQVKVEPVAAEVDYPPGSNDRYEGPVEIPIRIALPAGERAVEFEATVTYQACTESECLPPVEKRVSGVLVR